MWFKSKSDNIESQAIKTLRLKSLYFTEGQPGVVELKFKPIV